MRFFLPHAGCYRKYIAVIVSLTGLAPFIQAQNGGSRPIEFFEPREKATTATSPSEINAKQQRLNALEDQFPKNFDLFRAGDSISSGLAFPTPPRRPTAPRPSKPSGILEGMEDWLQNETLQTVSGSTQDTFSFDNGLDASSSQQFGTQSAILDSLRGEDWLLKGTMGATFWRIPVVPENTVIQQNPWDASPRFGFDAKNGIVNEDFTSRLEGLPGTPSRSESRIEAPRYRSMNQSSGGWDEYNLGQIGRKPVQDQRREQYRDLLGLNANSLSHASGTAAVNGASRQGLVGSYPSYVSTASSDAITRSGPPNSLHSVGAAGRNSLYPSSPYAPQLPSVFDPIEVESPTRPIPASDRRVSSPLFQAPKREF